MPRQILKPPRQRPPQEMRNGGARPGNGAAAQPEQASRQKNILLISLFHPELVRGGAQQVCYELFEGLKLDARANVVLLASVDETYPALYKSGARITGFDGRANEYIFLSREYDHWWHKTASPFQLEAFEEFLLAIRPDIVHFHHFITLGVDLLSLTRRVLPACRIIFTFHEFLAICIANGHMVRRSDNSLCTHASQIRCHQCFPDQSPEQFLIRKAWLLRHFSEVDAFTCPSRFMIEHYIRWGIPKEKTFHVTNGQRNYAKAGRLPAASPTRNRFGFFGQFVDAKGIQVLLRAVSQLRLEGFQDFVVELNGDNLRYASEKVRAEIGSFFAAEDALRPSEQIVFQNGSYQVDELENRMGRVDWCVVPSIWWEAFGLVISEAWMFGRPVICSNVGGMAERVEDGVHGLHFQMGDHRSLAAVIRRACTEDGLWQKLRDALPAPPARDAMIAGYWGVYAMPMLFQGASWLHAAVIEDAGN